MVMFYFFGLVSHHSLLFKADACWPMARKGSAPPKGNFEDHNFHIV